jgi:hypothetical protein
MIKTLALVGTYKSPDPRTAREDALNTQNYHNQQCVDLDIAIAEGYHILSTAVLPASTGTYVMLILYKPADVPLPLALEENYVS